MPEHALKLVKDKPVTSDPLKFERRRAPRHTAHGRVTAITQRADKPSSPHKICSFVLTDMSPTGLGVLSSEAVGIGDEVTVYLPPHGPESGFEMNGIVVRCELHGNLHALGIKMAPRQVNAA